MQVDMDRKCLKWELNGKLIGTGDTGKDLRYLRNPRGFNLISTLRQLEFYLFII